MPGTVIVTILLLAVVGLAVYGTIKRIRYGSECCGSREPNPSRIKVKDKDKKHYPYVYRIKVDGMHCSGCVRRLENAFHKKEGLWATVNLENKEVILQSKKELEKKEVGLIIAGSGFTMLSFDKS